MDKIRINCPQLKDNKIIPDQQTNYQRGCNQIEHKSIDNVCFLIAGIE